MAVIIGNKDDVPDEISAIVDGIHDALKSKTDVPNLEVVVKTEIHSIRSRPPAFRVHVTAATVVEISGHRIPPILFDFVEDAILVNTKTFKSFRVGFSEPDLFDRIANKCMSHLKSELYRQSKNAQSRMNRANANASQMLAKASHEKDSLDKFNNAKEKLVAHLK